VIEKKCESQNEKIIWPYPKKLLETVKISTKNSETKYFNVSFNKKEKKGGTSLSRLPVSLEINN